MSRTRKVVALVLALVALTLVIAACGDDEETTTTTSPAALEAPTGGAAPSVAGLPPEFVECMADQGFQIESSAEVHSAPPEVLQACFGH